MSCCLTFGPDRRTRVRGDVDGGAQHALTKDVAKRDALGMHRSVFGHDVEVVPLLAFRPAERDETLDAVAAAAAAAAAAHSVPQGNKAGRAPLARRRASPRRAVAQLAEAPRPPLVLWRQDERRSHEEAKRLSSSAGRRVRGTVELHLARARRS